ncbi:hypothetical protein [Glycomyces rhizosphaerae]|uniref:Glycosyltransferase subfamily 4-like N-terminal domain-containing protein n=1 Tax=Glycomyces rhizosphaerae TaxID=2054422 RepID=A0ABV7PVA8_9ACTN
MNIVFVAPKSAWRDALAAETRAAADAGHRVRVVAEDWEGSGLDARVETRWIGAKAVEFPESLLVRLFLRRLPLGALRRIGRGPLRGPAERVSRAWRRTFLGPLKRRRNPRTEAMREQHRIARVRQALDDWEPDWIVLHEPLAVELGVHCLPALLDARPDLKTTFSFETRSSLDPAHAG